MVDLEALDEKSRVFAAELFRTAPQLRRHARDEPSPGGAHFLVLTLDPPSGRRSQLVVDTGDPDTISVHWGPFHREFYANPNAGRSSECAEALNLVEDILSGALTVYAIRREGRYVESGTVHGEREEARLLSRLPEGSELELWSWEGQVDSSVRAPRRKAR